MRQILFCDERNCHKPSITPLVKRATSNRRDKNRVPTGVSPSPLFEKAHRQYAPDNSDLPETSRQPTLLHGGGLIAFALVI